MNLTSEAALVSDHPAELPGEIDFNMTSAESIGSQLLGKLDAVRAYRPVSWSAVQKAWLVTGNAEVAEALKGDLPLSSGRFDKILGYIPEAERWRITTVRRIFPTFVVNMDPPQHTRLRRLLVKAFSRRVAEAYRPFIQQTIEAALDQAEQANEVEFIEQVARQIPGRLTLELLGLPQALFPKLQLWTNSISSALGGGIPTVAMLDTVEQTFIEMETLFSAEIRKRQAAPTDDFVSSLITAEDEGDRLTFEEVLGACFLTLSAGNNSTTNTLALGTVALARHPEARQQLLDHPERMSDSLMELMRFIAMSTNQVRLVTADFEWHGNRLRKGDLVNLLVAAANHDPAAFDRPGELDFSRHQGKNMTFAPGLHFCVGHFLARMQLGEFYPRVFGRFPDLQILDDELNWSNAFNFRGLKSLRVRMKPNDLTQASSNGLG
jgi:cytochrome P450